jgi:hypothetical protein
MGRDLLYKPSVPFQLPDDEEEGGKVKKKKQAQQARELGRVGSDAKSQMLAKKGAGAQKAAYDNPYFNQDVSALRQANFASKPMASLRGDEAASDLRQVVLPAAAKEVPQPEELSSVGELMGLGSSERVSIQGLLGRQAGWLQAKGVTVEMIEARMAQLEEMVAARKAALARVAASSGEHGNVTLVQAMAADGGAMEAGDNLADEATRLVRGVEQEAGGMHVRLAKTLGLKNT